MSYLDHIRACNTGDPSRYWPFLVDARRLGWIRPKFAERLARMEGVFDVAGGTVALAPGLPPDCRERGAIVAAALAPLVDEGLLPKPRGEDYGIVRHWGEPAALLLERKFVPAFGATAHGVHVNGFVEDKGRLKLWIGKRAADKDVAPGKLDNMIAGGQPYGLSLIDNVVKEAGEEAALTPALARTARPCGVISYLMEDALGLKPDMLFVYDLAMPRGLIPNNTDGEIAEFMLMDAEDVAEAVRTGDGFKFNVNLVIIDFLIRHGLITPENEPDYVEIASGLRRAFDAQP